MYNKRDFIKNAIENDLSIKFGETVKRDVFSLIDRLTGKDSFVDSHLLPSLQNILSLKPEEAAYFSSLALDLASASAFAPVLLLEKIPTLCFYGITDQVGSFLSNIKNYGARAIALFLGSDQLKTDDLIDILEHSTTPYYTALLNAVNKRHREFGVCCGMIMRSAAKIESVIPVEAIEAYLDVCACLIVKFGTKIAEQYISRADQFHEFVPLNKSVSTIGDWYSLSPVSAEFVVSHPKIAFSSPNKPIKDDFTSEMSLSDIKSIKINILKNEDYVSAFNSPQLLNDKYFAAMLLNWPNLSASLKVNILFQLHSQNYKQYILTNPAIQDELKRINAVTRSNWLRPWVHSGKTVDLDFIRLSIGALLKKNNFSIEAKSIVKSNASLFDRANQHYDAERVTLMAKVLLSYCVDETDKNALVAMVDFLAGNTQPLIDSLSQTSLVIQAWDRDPWVDYGQSDEFYSCTSLGDYNAGNAPAFLADLNLNNLDVWSNGLKVGRIHLCLAHDSAGRIILLLDCVDGTERMITSKAKFDAIMDAVIDYAHFISANFIKINHDIDYNTTPKKFIRYVEAEFQGQQQMDFISRYLTVSTTRQLIPYPCQTFLESFVKNNAGFVRGAFISL